MNLKKLDTKLVKKLGTILAIIVILLIIMFIFMLFNSKKFKYTDLETKLLNAAKEYYKTNPEDLPQIDGGYVTISSDKLIEEKYLKTFESYLKVEESNCSGQVKVTKNVEYLYSVTLVCGEDYETKKLKDLLLENVVTEGNGLYEYNGRYIFRGDNVNNYIKFANKTWLIIGINADGTIRLIDQEKKDTVVWDDRYNSEKQLYFGINDYEVSRIKDNLNEQYNSLSNSDKAYLTKYNLCIGKRNEDDTDNSGTIECSNTLNDQYVGLLYANEFALASLDKTCLNPTDQECSNYNYLSPMRTFWTATADSEKTYRVYKIAGSAILASASTRAQADMVVNINDDVNYVSGNGSEENPYIFK